MKRFQFSLQALLRYREFLEQKARQEVAKAQAEVLVSENRIRELLEDYGAKTLEFERAVTTGISCERFLRHNEYLGGMETEIGLEREHHKMLVAAVLEKQKAVAKRSVEKKMLENLKEKKKKEFYEEMTQMLHKEADDMTILRRARNNEG